MRNECVYIYSNASNVIFRLAEVGKLVLPKVKGEYETGQFFLHRIFGYRGVILFPWVAKMYDRTTSPASTTEEKATDEDKGTVSAKNPFEDEPKEPLKSDAASSPDTETTTTKEKASPRENRPPKHSDNKGMSVRNETFYQVLIDSRDCPYVVRLV